MRTKLGQALGFGLAASLFGWASSTTATPNGLSPSDSEPTAASNTGDVEATAANDWFTICLSHRDDFQQSAGVAEANGWMVAPDHIIPPLKNSVGKPQVWLRSSAAGFKFLAIGIIADGVIDDGPKVTGRFCAVGVTPANAGLEKEVGVLVRTPPNPSASKPGHIIYVYRHTLQGPMPIMDDLKSQATIQAIQSSDVDIVQVGEYGKISLVALVTPENK